MIDVVSMSMKQCFPNLGTPTQVRFPNPLQLKCSKSVGESEHVWSDVVWWWTASHTETPAWENWQCHVKFPQKIPSALSGSCHQQLAVSKNKIGRTYHVSATTVLLLNDISTARCYIPRPTRRYPIHSSHPLHRFLSNPGIPGPIYGSECLSLYVLQT